MKNDIAKHLAEIQALLQIARQPNPAVGKLRAKVAAAQAILEADWQEPPPEVKPAEA